MVSDQATSKVKNCTQHGEKIGPISDFLLKTKNNHCQHGPLKMIGNSSLIIFLSHIHFCFALHVVISFNEIKCFKGLTEREFVTLAVLYYYCQHQAHQYSPFFLPTVPSVPPQLTVASTSPTDIRLTWRPLSSQNSRGAVTRYRIDYCTLDQGE